MTILYCSSCYGVRGILQVMDINEDYHNQAWKDFICPRCKLYDCVSSDTLKRILQEKINSSKKLLEELLENSANSCE